MPEFIIIDIDEKLYHLIEERARMNNRAIDEEAVEMLRFVADLDDCAISVDVDKPPDE